MPALASGLQLAAARTPSFAANASGPSTAEHFGQWYKRHCAVRGEVGSNAVVFALAAKLVL